eukprot:276395-Pyramimonas_sp.AAC.1
MVKPVVPRTVLEQNRHAVCPGLAPCCLPGGPRGDARAASATAAPGHKLEHARVELAVIWGASSIG